MPSESRFFSPHPIAVPGSNRQPAWRRLIHQPSSVPQPNQPQIQPSTPFLRTRPPDRKPAMDHLTTKPRRFATSVTPTCISTPKACPIPAWGFNPRFVIARKMGAQKARLIPAAAVHETAASPRWDALTALAYFSPESFPGVCTPGYDGMRLWRWAFVCSDACQPVSTTTIRQRANQAKDGR